MFDLLDIFLRAAVVGVALYCLFACICRVDVLHWRQHERGWVMAYVLQGGFAAGTGLRTVLEGLPGDAQIMGLVAACLFLRTSRRRWNGGAPADMAKAGGKHGAANSVPPGGTR